MSSVTAIEWTNATWNPVTGCTKSGGRLLDGREWNEWPKDDRTEGLNVEKRTPEGAIAYAA